MLSEDTSSRDGLWHDVMTNINMSCWRVSGFKETLCQCVSCWGEGEQTPPALCLSSSLAQYVSSLTVLHVQMAWVSAFPWDSVDSSKGYHRDAGFHCNSKQEVRFNGLDSNSAYVCVVWAFIGCAVNILGKITDVFISLSVCVCVCVWQRQKSISSCSVVVF